MFSHSSYSPSWIWILSTTILGFLTVKPQVTKSQLKVLKLHWSRFSIFLSWYNDFVDIIQNYKVLIQVVFSILVHRDYLFTTPSILLSKNFNFLKTQPDWFSSSAGIMSPSNAQLSLLVRFKSVRITWIYSYLIT